MRILGIAGSLRAGSYNRRLLAHAAASAPARDVTIECWDGLGGIPPFNEDDEAHPGPDVQRLRAAITHADAVLFATPEYSGSVPGQLKNAVDWAARPAGAGVLTGKPVAVVGASPSGYGAVWAQAELRRVLGSAGARVLDRELAVARAHDAFDAGGLLLEPGTARALDGVATELVALVGSNTCPA